MQRTKLLTQSEHSAFELGMRECYACGSTKAYTDKRGYTNWYINRDTLGTEINALCDKCQRHLITVPNIPTWKVRDKTRRQICFLGKQITFGFRPRKGICLWCDYRGPQTVLHHKKYDRAEPLAHTVELCRSCHGKVSFALGQLDHVLRRGEVPWNRGQHGGIQT